MTIAIDFDGTIVEHRYPSIGRPKPFAFEALKAFQAEGHQLILWTTREGKRLEEAVEFCKENGIEFYAVNSEYPNDAWSGLSRKIPADVYIDDKNLGGLTDWGDIYATIMKKSGKDVFPDSQAHHRQHSRHHHKRLLDTPEFWKRFTERIKEARNTFRIN